MSDTPLTDANACDGWSGDAICVSVDFARKLERCIKIGQLLRDDLRAADDTDGLAEKWDAAIKDIEP